MEPLDGRGGEEERERLLEERELRRFIRRGLQDAEEGKVISHEELFEQLLAEYPDEPDGRNHGTNPTR